MNNQSQQFLSAARRTGAYDYGTGSSQIDELHMSGLSQHQPQHGQLPPREYPSSSTQGSHVKLEHGHANPSYQSVSSSSVPNVLQPGLHAGTMNPQQPQDYPPQRPGLNLAHNYPRSSPAAGYDGGSSSYAAYTPTTPSGSGGGGAGPSQFGPPSESKYAASTQRTVSNTPLGLADIRPRADSSMSDGVPGTMAYELANMQPTLSNYLAPWALFAFDWCKWQPGGNSAGKVAIGSYLEDGHNFVSAVEAGLTREQSLIARPLCLSADPNPRHPTRTRLTKLVNTWERNKDGRIHQGRRSNPFISRHQAALGAAIVTKADD
jgi:DDB1- and CUL4-associated factor 7